MRNLKTSSVSSRPVASRVDGANSAQSEKVASQPLDTQYPTIWKKAFALGQNVRFTRTPEVEILRKRVENDPDFAQKLKAFELEQRRRRENAPQKSAAFDLSQQKDDSRALADSENHATICAVKSEVTVPLQGNIDRQNGTGQQNLIGGETTQNQNPVCNPIALYLSDSAFFECGSVFLDGSSLDAPQAIAASAVLGQPEISDNKGHAPQLAVVEPEVAPLPITSDNCETLKVQKKSITDLYRVLECRFAKNNYLPSHTDNQEDENSEQQSADSDVEQTILPEETSFSDIEALPVLPFIGTELSNEDEPLTDGKPAIISVHYGEVVIENMPEKSDNETTSAEVSMAGASAITSDCAGSSPLLNKQNIMAAPGKIVEDIEPVVEDASSSSDEQKTVEQDHAVVPEVVVRAQTHGQEVEKKPQPVSTKATISAPLRTLNPAFIPSPKLEHNDSYVFPSVDLLQQPIYKDGAIISQETLERSAGLLESVLEDFGIKGEIIHVRPGPVVTMYEFEPAAGVKSSRVISLSDDIARSMSAISARVAVIPGRNVIGIELPNKVRETVYLRELIQSKAFQDSNYKLALTLGKNIGGEPVIAELAKMPHLLVAGTTGSGKSVAINAMILSLLYRLKPEQCRLIMVDPKMLELSIYDGIPHLLTPVVTDPKKAVTALKWAVREMEDRYRKMAKLGVRNIDGFNQRVSVAAEKGETITCRVQSGFDKETGEMLYHEEAMDLARLPYIVVIVDEMADLMMVAGKEIEGAIQRLAQMARAAGIHLIMATQRPSVDVITGTIKANFPTRISFQVTSKIDSRTILGEQGAETLLGQGDMLHMVGGGRIVRVHGPFVSDEEVEHVVAHLKTQGTPDYLATVTDGEDEEETIEDADSIADIVAAGNAGENVEELYLQAVKVVMRDKKCSTSYIQRRLGIGYNKAATLVERMEAEGIVGPANHVGKREILLNSRHGQDGFGN
ncbi:DNA translocase FtsK [uncultured Bartonella sp.]|uniref:DNA translocase FtsK n=1 Tax=uncultured Bartonella sp. TaxID=104108 RepID=UPI0026320298|nr:DNA translocase FtsK [uncultured Bartonella sp.]